MIEPSTGHLLERIGVNTPEVRGDRFRNRSNKARSSGLSSSLDRRPSYPPLVFMVQSWLFHYFFFLRDINEGALKRAEGERSTRFEVDVRF